MMPLIKFEPKEFRPNESNGGYALKKPRPHHGYPSYVICSPISMDRGEYNGLECTRISDGKKDYYLTETPEEVLSKFTVSIMPPPRNFRQGVKNVSG